MGKRVNLTLKILEISIQSPRGKRRQIQTATVFFIVIELYKINICKRVGISSKFKYNVDFTNVF